MTMALEPIRRAGAVEPCTRSSVGGVFRAPGQSLEQRMKAEAEAIRDLHKKALALSRAGSGDARFFPATRPRPAAALEAAAKKTKTTRSKLGTAAHQIKKPVTKPQPAAPTPPERLMMMKKAKEIIKAREIARAREECRRAVLETERTALPDETIYPQDLEELGIWDQYAVTRTWNRQAHGAAVQAPR
ncbi:hypothetical protein BS78_09G136400 [Paspalum vaginatum]|nr:hypothetical protein BS78_09G136400 [Paspalum vaginatum]